MAPQKRQGSSEQATAACFRAEVGIGRLASGEALAEWRTVYDAKEDMSSFWEHLVRCLVMRYVLTTDEYYRTISRVIVGRSSSSSFWIGTSPVTHGCVWDTRCG